MVTAKEKWTLWRWLRTLRQKLSRSPIKVMASKLKNRMHELQLHQTKKNKTEN